MDLSKLVSGGGKLKGAYGDLAYKIGVSLQVLLAASEQIACGSHLSDGLAFRAESNCCDYYPHAPLAQAAPLHTLWLCKQDTADV